MNLEHLRTVVTVWRERSISRAAAELRLTQPAVSGHVKSMEAALGRALFTRHARGVEPTEVADDLVREIGDAFERAEVAVERARLRSDASDGVVHIGSPAEFAGARFAPLAAKLIEAGFQVRLRLGGKGRLYEWLDAGEIDLAIVASEPQLASVDWQPIFVEKLLLVGAPALTPDPARPLSDWVRSVKWLAYDETMPLIRSWTSKVIGEGATAIPAFTVPSLTLLRDAAIDGAGVTVLPDYLCETALADGRLARLASPLQDPTNVISLCWRRRALRNATVAQVRDLCLGFAATELGAFAN